MFSLFIELQKDQLPPWHKMEWCVKCFLVFPLIRYVSLYYLQQFDICRSEYSLQCKFPQYFFYR